MVLKMSHRDKVHCSNLEDKVVFLEECIVRLHIEEELVRIRIVMS